MVDPVNKTTDATYRPEIDFPFQARDQAFAALAARAEKRIAAQLATAQLTKEGKS